MSGGNKLRRGDEDKEQDEFRKILENLLKESDNKKCADCGTAAPRWASATLGIFLCIKCSGIHRAMGTHISFVRSVSLDKWKPEEIAFMQAMGNTNAALSWEARLPTEYRRPSPNDGMALEKFIRDKYEHKRYYKPVDPKSLPSKADLSQPGTVSSNTTQPQTPAGSTNGIILHPPARSNTPLRTPTTTPTPPPAPQQPSLLVDPFFSSQTPSSSQHNGVTTSTPLFNPAAAAQNIKVEPMPQPVSTPAVDMNLVKKSNIMSMFDVQSEHQKQQQQMYYTGTPQQQQMYFAATPMYYTTSGGLVPVMYGSQIYTTPNVVYAQQLPQ